MLYELSLVGLMMLFALGVTIIVIALISCFFDEPKQGLTVPPGYKFGDGQATVKLEYNWEVSLVQLLHPIALVKFSRNLDRIHCKFNIDKCLFLDPTPCVITEKNRKKLSANIKTLRSIR